MIHIGPSSYDARIRQARTASTHELAHMHRVTLRRLFPSLVPHVEAVDYGREVAVSFASHIKDRLTLWGLRAPAHTSARELAGRILRTAYPRGWVPESPRRSWWQLA